MFRITCVLMVLCGFAHCAGAQEPDAETKYTAAITKRADDIVAKLGIADAILGERVRDRIVAQYRSLRSWHDEHGEAVSALKKANTSESAAELERTYASLREIHNQYLTDLSSDLQPNQIETVKDGMTFNVLNVTYLAYLDKIPSLTDEQKQYIKVQLTEARELAMDEGTSEAKHAVFGKYKGRINNYLSQAGYDLRSEEKAWQERLKARRAATTQSGDSSK